MNPPIYPCTPLSSAVAKRRLTAGQLPCFAQPIDKVTFGNNKTRLSIKETENYPVSKNFSSLLQNTVNNFENTILKEKYPKLLDLIEKFLPIYVASDYSFTYKLYPSLEGMIEEKAKKVYPLKRKL